MIPIFSLLIVLIFSVLVTRVAAIALVHTGLSMESARFQARSAFTGVGFTTSETEQVVNHPVRRRIILILMLMGNAGIITAVSSLILTFIPQAGQGFIGWKILVLFGGIGLIWWVVQSRFFERHLFNMVSKALKRYTDLDVKDYSSLLNLDGEYAVSELKVEAGDWVANRSLIELRLAEEGILVLGIKGGDGQFMGSPKADTVIMPEDVLILYGRGSSLKALDERKFGEDGDQEHKTMILLQSEVQISETMQFDARKVNR